MGCCRNRNRCTSCCGSFDNSCMCVSPFCNRCGCGCGFNACGITTNAGLITGV